MLFNSAEYIIFLVIVTILYWFTKHKSVQNLLLLFASISFYCFWSIKFLGLLIFVILIDYVVGFLIDKETNLKIKRLYLIINLVNNLGVLIVFKYYDFFVLEFNYLIQSFGINSDLHTLNLILPVGISFYTFHGMSYVIDIYNQKIHSTKSIVEYSLFVSFFPLLVAGPIERASHLLPQIKSSRAFNKKNFVTGLRLILYGLFKKIVIADSLASKVDLYYGNFESFSGVTLILATFAFSFQIYCDFSGYSDIALGSAKLLGFELLTNFNFPYFSKNINDFWKRWHISLTSWFRDYIYIPLGGSRLGQSKTKRNILLIFLISGLWHGASWNFIIWGFLNGLFLVFYKSFNSEIRNNYLKVAFTFMLVNFLWVFFRIDKIETIISFFKHIFLDIISNPKQLMLIPETGGIILIYILLIVLIDYFFRGNPRELKFPKNPYLRWLFYYFLFFTILYYYSLNNGQQFIYFEF
jgi:D-alanyl-lipoteichoic acid acyltransferase DltB (MBOAT superfamily)